MKPSSSPSKSPTHQLLGRLAIASTLAGLPACSANQQAVNTSADTESMEEFPRVREYTGLEITYPESVDIAERANAMKGYMEPVEVARMQTVHEKIYEQYANPGFITYLMQTGLADKAYPALNLVMQHPDDFEYEEKKYGRVEIVKRRPYTESNKHIPDDFIAVVETRGGSVTNTGGTDLTGGTGVAPWMSNQEYNRRMKHYRARFNSEFKQKGEWTKFHQISATWPEPARTEKLMDMLMAPYEKVSAEMKEIYALENIDFPRRLINLIEARNFGFETNDPRFQDMKQHQQHQGVTYTEITKQRYTPHNRRQLVVTADPDLPETYRIYTRASWQNPLRINTKGYMLVEQADGSWIPDPRYNNAVSNNYYNAHPQAPRH